MSKIQTAAQLVAACKKAATDHKTLYVLGCFGAPMTASNKTRYLNHQAYNRKADRKAKIQAAAADVFGFDCVCMIKGLFWGWDGDASKVYGGAGYAINGVPDVGADELIKICKDVSKDFSTIQPGEVVHIPGHVGIYIGDGLVVECTPKWKDGVQITAVHNISTKAGYNGRKWAKHGKLPWVTYEEVVPDSDTTGEPEPDYTLGMRILREGCTGEDVRALQILLKGRGYNCGNADGIFGAKTKCAVILFQNKVGLDPDGIAGILTLSALWGVN